MWVYTDAYTVPSLNAEWYHQGFSAWFVYVYRKSYFILFMAWLYTLLSVYIIIFCNRYHLLNIHIPSKKLISQYSFQVVITRSVYASLYLWNWIFAVNMVWGTVQLWPRSDVFKKDLFCLPTFWMRNRCMIKIIEYLGIHLLLYT